jgi:peptide/nickel transport system substrate-binding protein
MPRGGTLRLGMRVIDVSNPHTYSWVWDSNVARQVTEYLTITGHDNVTRPYLLEEWEPSEDLRTWTLHLRKGVKWHNGRDLVAEDVAWNINRVLEERTGSSVLGLMKGYMLEEFDRDGETHTRLWDTNAIDQVDDYTIQLNCKTPQLAVPEHLFHYPMLILDPEENGVFGPGSNGTGAFELVAHDVGKRSVLHARRDYWGEGPYVDTLEFVDLGDDPTGEIDAMASKRIHGVDIVDIIQLEAFKLMPHLRMHEVVTASTAVARGKVTHEPFDDPRVRLALRLAIDCETIQQLVHADRGVPAEHHHVSPAHPEYARLPVMHRDVTRAKALLAEAGFADGIDLGQIDCLSDPSWQFNAVQALVEQWKDAGIKVRINLMASADYWVIWDKTPFGFTGWTHRPLGVMALGLGYRSGVPWNESGYANPEFDRLLTEAEGLLDIDARREVMTRLERIMQEDGPIIQPLWRSELTFMDKRVRGFRMHPSTYIFGNQLAIDP